MAEDTIKVGVLATFEGAFTVLGDDSMRGAVMAVDDFGGKVGGKKIEIVKGSSDGSPDSAVRAIRKLVEQDGAKVVVGPLSGDEGLAVKDYAQDQAGRDHRQRHVGGAGHDIARSGSQFLPLLDRRRAVDGRPGRLRLQHQEATSESRLWRRIIRSRTRRCSASWRRSARPAATW